MEIMWSTKLCDAGFYPVEKLECINHVDKCKKSKDEGLGFCHYGAQNRMLVVDS